jgi:phosphate transport system substrate-binding protein
VSLFNAQLNTDPTSPEYLTEQLNGVYTGADRRTYPLSYYAYLIVPKVLLGQFSPAKGQALGAFAYYGVCGGQQNAALFGYAPLPINLVQAAFDQIRNIPGADTTSVTIQGCNNPTFSPDGTNILAANAPYPPACDKQGPIQCGTITPPPAVPEGRPVWLMAVGLAVIGGWALLRRRRRRTQGPLLA